MRFDHRRLSVGIALLGVSMPLYAVDLGSDTFSLSGFGTVGAVHSSAEQGDFVSDSNVPRGSGRSESVSFSQMTRLGLQGDLKFNDRWSGTTQLVSEYTPKGDYVPYVNNIFVKYQGDTFFVRAGRMVQPFYMLTEFARVGYAVPWARPPVEMYDNFPLYDGVEVSKKLNVSDVGLTLSGFYGKGFLDVRTSPDSSIAELDAKSTFGVSLTAEKGNWTVFVSHIENQLKRLKSSGSDALMAFYRNSPNATARALAERYDPNQVKGVYDSLGVSYDSGVVFARSEVAHSQFDTFVGGNKFVGYVTGGFRVGQWAPYLTYGINKYDSPTTLGSGDPFGFMNRSLASYDASRHSISIGTRWDFKKDMDLKLQLTRVMKDSDTSNMGLNNRAQGATMPAGINVLFAGVDFVF